tara:strand:+ start:166 stop:552 length:387 start_codon:yes stop_codon:yes gene_type:complete
VCETNIVVLHDQIPQRISLPDHLAFLLRFSRRHRSSRDVCITTKPTSLLLFLSLFVFRQRRKNAVLERGKRQDKIFIKEEQKKKGFPRYGTYLHDANTTQRRADSYDYPASCTKRQKKRRTEGHTWIL